MNAALSRSISRNRLEKYLEASNDDLDQALTLYEWNTRLAEALYTPLQSVEVCLRNMLHESLASTYGSDWLLRGGVPLMGGAQRAIADAGRMQRGVTAGAVIANLPFSFWVGLLGPAYDQTIWRQAAHTAFRADGGKARGAVHGRLNAIRRFRNRVAHHEPIFDRAADMHNEIIEAIGWMCRDTMAWTTAHSHFPKVSAPSSPATAHGND